MGHVEVSGICLSSDHFNYSAMFLQFKFFEMKLGNYHGFRVSKQFGRIATS